VSGHVSAKFGLLEVLLCSRGPTQASLYSPSPTYLNMMYSSSALPGGATFLLYPWVGKEQFFLLFFIYNNHGVHLDIVGDPTCVQFGFQVFAKLLGFWLLFLKFLYFPKSRLLFFAIEQSLKRRFSIFLSLVDLLRTSAHFSCF
jgi:hypothetical protein